ncbi:MAG: YtxH domain-containing protein [Ornithinimicrobium sp.]
MRRLILLAGVAIGYILGAKAGRERYEQLADQASKVWSDPRVQTKVDEVKEQAPHVAAAVGDKAKSAASQAKSKATGHESADQDGSYENETGSVSSDGTAEVDTTGFGPGGDRLP